MCIRDRRASAFTALAIGLGHFDPMLGLRLPNTAATARCAACGHRRAMGDATVGPGASRRAAAGVPRTTLTVLREETIAPTPIPPLRTAIDATLPSLASEAVAWNQDPCGRHWPTGYGRTGTLRLLLTMLRNGPIKKMEGATAGAA